LNFIEPENEPVEKTKKLGFIIGNRRLMNHFQSIDYEEINAEWMTFDSDSE
jgi:hypothetical protein